jgi:hypothetical protein
MLRVESFTPDPDAVPARGTVKGHSYVTFGAPNAACSEPASQQCQETDFHWYTCGNSCINLCRLTGDDPTCIQ